MRLYKLKEAYKAFAKDSPGFCERYPTFLKFWWLTIQKRDFHSFAASGIQCVYAIVEKSPKNEATITDFLVLTPFRNMGLGTTAMRALIENYETRGFVRLNIILSKDNVKAIAMFVSNLGFLVDAAETNKLMCYGVKNQVSLYCFLR